jgi:hypothetical protein
MLVSPIRIGPSFLGHLVGSPSNLSLRVPPIGSGRVARARTAIGARTHIRMLLQDPGAHGLAAAADRWEVDRSTVMRLREVARQGALAALVESRPGTRSKETDLELTQAKAEATRLGEGRCCVAPTQGRLKANLGWDQIAKPSSSNATATRRLVGSTTASS